jgi:hypothetical protein
MLSTAHLGLFCRAAAAAGCRCCLVVLARGVFFPACCLGFLAGGLPAPCASSWVVSAVGPDRSSGFSQHTFRGRPLAPRFWSALSSFSSTLGSLYRESEMPASAWLPPSSPLSLVSDRAHAARVRGISRYDCCTKRHAQLYVHASLGLHVVDGKVLHHTRHPHVVTWTVADVSCTATTQEPSPEQDVFTAHATFAATLTLSQLR